MLEKSKEALKRYEALVPTYRTGMEQVLEKDLSHPDKRMEPVALSIDVRVQGALEATLQDESRRAQDLPVLPLLKVGDTVDGLTVTAIVADNGIHRLYQVRDGATQRLYALKTLLPTRAHDAEERAMLAHEAWLARRMATSRAAEHLVAVHDADITAISYETDRARFLGRGNTPRAPHALLAVDALSDSEGSVLDPIVAIRCRISLDAGQSASIDLVTGLSTSREGCLQLIGKYRDRYLADRVFDLAWTHSQVLLRQLNASLAEARLFQQMAASLLVDHFGLLGFPREPVTRTRSGMRCRRAVFRRDQMPQTMATVPKAATAASGAP